MDDLFRVVDHVRRMGGPSAVSRKLGVSRQAVYNWIDANRVGAWHVWAFANLAGLTPKELRPDMFDNTRAGEPAPAAQQMPRGRKKAAAALE